MSSYTPGLMMSCSRCRGDLTAACSCANQCLRELLGRITALDATALTQLHQTTVRTLFIAANRILRCKRDSEEVIGDVFLYVWNHVTDYDHRRGTVMAWLVIMTKHRAIDCLRRRPRHTRLLLMEPDSSDLFASDVTRAIADAEDHVALRAALSQLSAYRRAVIQLSFYEGWSHTRIASTLGKPLGTVKSDLRRAIKSMHSLVSTPRVDTIPASWSTDR